MSRGGTPRKKPAQGNPPYWTEAEGNHEIWETIKEINLALERDPRVVSGKNVQDGQEGSKIVSFHLEVPAAGNPASGIVSRMMVVIKVSRDATAQGITIIENNVETVLDAEDLVEGKDVLQPLIGVALGTLLSSKAG